MKNGIILEIAVASTLSQALERLGLYPTPDRHYWRARYIEDGEEMVADCDSGTLAAAARFARTAGQPVAWRYYETGV